MIRIPFILIMAILLASPMKAMVADSLIVECKVVDAESNQPVSAQIRYELMPYGDKIGIRHGASCTFRMEQTEEYTVRVMADGYLPGTVHIKYSTYAGAGRIVKNIPLTPMAAGKTMRLESLTFAVASSVINRDAYEELDKLASILVDNPAITIQLEGHTDYIGDPKLNMKLSEERVKATRDYLINKGIDKSRITIKAFGGTKPLSRENTPEAHELNRRVEVRIISQ